MKIQFYTLPKAERQSILNQIEELTQNIQRYRNEHGRYTNLAESARFNLEVEKTVLNKIKEKYSFD